MQKYEEKSKPQNFSLRRAEMMSDGRCIAPTGLKTMGGGLHVPWVYTHG